MARSFEASVGNDGASWGALDPWFDGVVSRGVLLDVAAGRPGGFVALGQPVTPPELDAAAARSGLHIACLEWLRERDVAAIAWDLMDERPVGYEGLQFGVHLAIPILGLCLIDNTYPERLVAACAEERRAEFVFMAMPLRIRGSTGSPCQPVAVF